MADAALVKKLGIKPNQRLLLINAPDDYAGKISPLPEGATLSTAARGTFDYVQLFVTSQAELRRDLPKAVKSLKPGGVLWLSFPKKTSKIKSDLTRDVGWEPVTEAGLDFVMLIAVDETWSAMRVRPGPGYPSDDKLFEAQYAGAKAALRPIYDRLAAAVTKFGPDVKLETRKTYVAMTRTRQFGLIVTSTRTRLDVGIKLPGVEPAARLQAAGGFGSGQVTHRVALASLDDIDAELLGWLRKAYEGVK